MDGNGRWAKRRHMPRVAGHRAGVAAVRSTVETAARVGIQMCIRDRCGTVLQDIPPTGLCPKCGFELHSCRQCMYFDPGSRFECMQPVPERIPRKDARNNCTFYEIRVTREKETSTPASLRPNDARQAFENLFKK